YLNSDLDYMTVHAQGDDYTLHVSPAPFASRKGAVDMMMFSLAEALSSDAVGVVLSGHGVDGSEGMEEIIHRGGFAVVQEPKSCLCKEMPLAVISRNESSNVYADTKIASVINNL
ncbi:MAG: chemotaxis protein CheB, partial [Gammaproteobacteria bacterium]|nr:chemotaxis protein CheB [Gammaproteobacteria bacterium]